MKKIVTQLVIVTLVQGENMFKMEMNIDSEKTDELAGTITNQILRRRARQKQYGSHIGGNFAFGRKFETICQVGEKSLSLGFTVTLLKETSIAKFAHLVKDTIEDIQTGANQEIMTFEEVIKEFAPSLN